MSLKSLSQIIFKQLNDRHRLKKTSNYNSLGNHKSNRHEDPDERRENPNQEERLNLLALPQLHRRLAALDERELHDVEHEDELRDRKHRQERTERKSDPQNELIEDESEARVGDVELGKVVLVWIRSESDGG